MKITLIGGPYNGRSIKDSGTVLIRMGIASEWQGQRPSIGANTGFAIYEPSEDRTKAFWRENIWDGKVVDVVEIY